MKKEPTPSSRSERRKLARQNKRAYGKAVMREQQRMKKQRLYAKKKAARKLARKQRKSA